MTREEFKHLTETRVLLLDGATGSNLMEMGMPPGAFTEQWVLENPEKIKKLKNAYVDAGTQLILAPTFRANSEAMKENGIKMSVEEMNMELVNLSDREQLNGKALTGGDIAMTGLSLIPNGGDSFDKAFEIYKEQGEALAKAGVDYFDVETMVDLQEMRAALLAFKSVSDIPFMATFSVNDKGFTFLGTNIEAAAVTLERMGADAVGINCSDGPDKMLDIVKVLREAVDIPVIVKLNAGSPKEKDGRTVYTMTAEEFKACYEKIVDLGADLIGGCCGTTPEFIAALKSLLEEKGLYVPLTEEGKRRERPALHKYKNSVTGKRKVYMLSDFMDLNRDGVLSENPSLKECVLSGEYDDIYEELEDVEDDELLVVGFDDVEGLDDSMIEHYLGTISAMNIPVCVESASPEILEKALKYYPGIAAVKIDEMKNRADGEAVAGKYGAVIL